MADAQVEIPVGIFERVSTMYLRLPEVTERVDPLAGRGAVYGALVGHPTGGRSASHGHEGYFR